MRTPTIRDVDLHSTALDDEFEVEPLAEGAALSTYTTTSTAGTASCPVSSAGTAMTAMCVS